MELIRAVKGLSICRSGALEQVLDDFQNSLNLPYACCIEYSIPRMVLVKLYGVFSQVLRSTYECHRRFIHPHFLSSSRQDSDRD